MYQRQRKNRGSGLVETAAGLILVIPVLLCLIDVAALVLTQTANDALAKQCARAAAEAPIQPPGGAQAAADGAFAHYADTTLMQKVSCVATPSSGTDPTDTVRVDTVVICKLPVPIPFGGPATQQFQAFSVEPVVGQAP
jgi:Flp pilus assembly protein TadG